MLRQRLRTFALAGALTLAGALQIAPAAATVQSSPDIIRISFNDNGTLYQVDTRYAPVIVNLPDGGAWGFFTAQLRLPSEPGGEPIRSNITLFATRFDPGTGAWLPAQPLPGVVSLYPTAVADSSGTVHLVYLVKDSPDDSAVTRLIYISVDSTGTWSEPQAVAPSDTAGFQSLPDLTIDADGGLHLAWQDQRGVSDAIRAASPTNADVFVSDLNPDGTWSDPVQFNVRPDDKTNASRPQIVADGDRLVAVWSVYNTDVGLDTAVSLMSAQREMGDPNSWTEPQQIIERGDNLIGGRFVDLADDPTGGVTLIQGRRTANGNELYLQRMAQDADSWSDPALIASGDKGFFPHVAISADGTTYVVFNLGSSPVVKVAAVAVAPGQTIPGAEETLSAGEEGSQGIASVSIDALGRPWVMYFSQPPQQSIATEARVLRSASISSEPATQAPAQSSPAADGTPEAIATPAG